MKKGTKPAVLLLAGLLLLSGCTLAQPERQSVSQDRFIGFQLVYEENRTIDMSDPDWQEQEASIEPEDRSHWVEYGTQNVQTDRFGTLSLPREILIGEYDEEHNRFYFPGKEGYNCFLAKRPSSQGGEQYVGNGDLCDATIKVGGEEEGISGTVFAGPPLAGRPEDPLDYVWTAYRVYEMADGTVYLDGTGSSYAAGMGGFSTSMESKETRTVDGEEETYTFKAEFTLEWVERTEQIQVTWFGGDDLPLDSRTLTMAEVGEGLELERPAGAVWALIAITDTQGTVERSILSLKADGVAQRLIQLDETGAGRVVYLTLH